MSRYPRCDPEATDAPDLQEWQEDHHHDASWGMRVGFVDPYEDLDERMARMKQEVAELPPGAAPAPPPRELTPLQWLSINLVEAGRDLGNPFVRVLLGLHFHWRDDAAGTSRGADA